MAEDEIFADLNVTTTSYKEVNGHKILVYVMVPKNLTPGKHPIIVRWHGGFMMTGSGMIWFQPWLVKYALLHSAIIVAPDYRLMPEATGLDILEDVSDLWDFVYTKLQSTVGDEVELDMGKIMVEGDSGGGYLAVQSVLTQGKKVSAMMAVYPPIDLKIPFFTEAYEKVMGTQEMLPPDTLEKYTASLTGSEVVSCVTPPARLDLVFSSIQQGNYVKLVGEHPSLFPMEVLDSVKDICSIFIIHGKEDSVVPYRSSEAFVEKMKQVRPEVKLRYALVPGEHAVDFAATLETDYLKEGLEFITPEWLGSSLA